MPAKPTPPPEPDPSPAPPAPTDAAPEPPGPGADLIPGRLPAGIYEFGGPLPTQYLDVPLTARPAADAQAATVFDWPFGAPDDGRWTPTRKKPNQAPDNEPAAPSTEE